MATQNAKVGDKIKSADGKWRGDRYKVEVSASAVTTLDDTDSPYTMETDEAIFLADSTAGAVTIVTPLAADAAGMRIIVKNAAGTNGVIIDPPAAELVDGGATYAALDAVGDIAEFVCDGVEWHLLESTVAP